MIDELEILMLPLEHIPLRLIPLTLRMSHVDSKLRPDPSLILEDADPLNLEIEDFPIEHKALLLLLPEFVHIRRKILHGVDVIPELMRFPQTLVI
jgi:hypothetical protein